MGTNFYITPREDIDPDYEPTGEKFRLEPDLFAEALKARWKNTEIGISHSEHFDMRWECEVKNSYTLQGWLFHDSCGVVLEKPGVKDVEEFAIWFRTLIPAHVNLVTYNSSNITSFELKTDTTYLQIVNFFSQYDYWVKVTSPTPENGSIDLEKLAAHLERKWPQVEIFPIIADDPYVFYWEVKYPIEYVSTVQISGTETISNSSIHDTIQTGAVGKDRSSLYLTYFPSAELAKVLIWYRSVVDENIELVAELKIDQKRLMLRNNTTSKEIVDTFRREWESE